ncbi:hypothetical protein QYE76_040618 [Lolium multiflorum]|uniref:Retrotransposon gag domain-containing protein n=1 Tax=Lolium multiflorum TaxID=4521 RepID=A0AAD8WT94_LOLMU|nr:hypothetical protein QYE76_040618 [Lolium multiflorum]
MGASQLRFLFGGRQQGTLLGGTPLLPGPTMGLTTDDSVDTPGESFAPLVPLLAVPLGTVFPVEGFIGELGLLCREFLRSPGENLCSLERAAATHCAVTFLKALLLESVVLVAWVACSCCVGSELVGPAYATGWSVWLASRGGGPGSFGAAFVVCGWIFGAGGTARGTRKGERAKSNYNSETSAPVRRRGNLHPFLLRRIRGAYQATPAWKNDEASLPYSSCASRRPNRRSAVAKLPSRLRCIRSARKVLEAIMAYTFPKRTLRQVEGWLGDYEGPLTDLLRGMLKELHCETRIPVFKYIYYDGEIVAKHRVSVQLPMRLEMSRIMPYGEAKTFTTAFHMAIFKAILEIRQHKSVELLCSEYSHIPHAEEDEDPALNHLLMANKHPEVAAQHMDSCKSLLTTMYLLHVKMVGEIDHMLAEFTDPDKVQARMHDLRAQPQYTTPFFSLNNPVDWSGQATQRDPLTPNFVPHYPHVSASYDSGYGGDNSWNLNCSESPIENSTGWRFGEPYGDEEEPIPCDTGDESGGVNQYDTTGRKRKGKMALVETEDARREREAKEKEEADAAARAEDAPPPHPMMHPDFQQYMRAMEEDRRRYQESQNKNMQDFFTHVINDRGPAASWWENLVAVHPPEKVFTREEFKKKFRDAHVPESVVELKKREFDELHQNTAPIMQYVRDFNRLSRYAPEEVDTEEKRKKRFMKGMNPYMKMQLRLARTAEFQELIDSAITFEDDYRSRRIGGRRLVSSQGSTRRNREIGVSDLLVTNNREVRRKNQII